MGMQRGVKFQGVVGCARLMWLFTRAKTHAAYLVCAIVQNGARGKIFRARDFSTSVGAAKTHLGAINWRFFGRGTIIALMLSKEQHHNI
jgi:hypothetical protein